MNPIIKKLLESRFNYCHALEVESVYDIQNTIESIINEGWQKEDVKEFFNTISIYCLNEENENEVYNFNTEQYMEELLP